MIKVRYSRLYTWFFLDLYFGSLMKTHFRKTTVISDIIIPENQSILLLQNHFSWWDGYWSYLLCQKTFKRKFHVMMLEEQLSKRLFLHRCGFFSVKKNSREALDSLSYSSDLLKNPKNLVAIYPTGKFLTQHQQIMPFQKGIERIIKGETQHIAIVLAVFLIDYFGYAKPEIRIYLENYSGERTAKDIENAYHSFYQTCISKQTEF